MISDLFIPSERNNYRARILHIKALTYYVLIVFAFGLIYKTTSAIVNYGQVLGIATDITVEKVFEITNKERLKNGLPPLAYNKKLEQAAYEKAKNMMAYDYWAHYGPDSTAPWDFILSTGYKYQYAGENLAKDFMFSEAVIKAWMNSPTHRENILRPEYHDVGLAVVNGTLNGAPTTLVVQFFGASFDSESDNDVLAATGVKPVFQPQSAIKKISYGYGLGLLAFLILTLIIDLYWAYKLRLIQVAGKHLAHGIFLIIIMLALVIATKGVIL